MVEGMAAKDFESKTERGVIVGRKWLILASFLHGLTSVQDTPDARYHSCGG